MMRTISCVLLLIATVCVVPAVAIEYIYTPLTRAQMDKVVDWGVRELFFRNSDVCWKDSYTNGVGRPMICAPGLSQEGALCYTKCKPGYDHTPAALNCRLSNCPSGFNEILDNGAFCTKPRPYGRGAGRSCLHGLFKCDCRSNEDKRGAMCYPKCRSGFHAVGCCVCSPNCPSGWDDIGVSCKKPSHRRSVAPLSACPDGYQKSGLLCYPKCRPGYSMVGPVCWKTCPQDQKSPCGHRLLCSQDSGRCAIATVDMVLAPITVVANLFTFGAASKVAAAQRVLTQTFRLSRESATRLSKLISAGSITSQQGLLIDSEIQTIIDAFESGIEELYQPMEKAYGTINAVKGLREIAIAQAMVIVATSLKEYGLAVASLVDPTGIVGVIAAFAQPKCRERQAPPNIPGIARAPPAGVTIAPPTRPPTPPTPTSIPCAGRDSTPRPTCMYGTAIWSPVTCSYQCPTRCADGKPFHDCSNVACTSTTCQNGYQCHVNPCGNTTCTTTCIFNPQVACTIDPCTNKQVQAECEPNTCVADYTFGCDYTCTPKNTTCSPSPSDEDDLPDCRGVATWDIVTCSWQCPSVCPDGTPLRSCSSNTCDDCLPGYECIIDYCSGQGQQCNKTCIPPPPPPPSTESACTTNPCQTQQAIDGCVENTCTYNTTSGCDFTCSYRGTSVLTATFSLSVSFPSNSSWDVICISIQSQLRDFALRAEILEYFIINENDIIKIWNSTKTSTSYRITIGIRGNTETQQEQMLQQFLNKLDSAAIEQEQNQQQVHPFDTTNVEIKRQIMYAQTCPDGSTIGVSATCIDNQAVAGTVSSSPSSSSSSMSTATIMSIVIPIVVVTLVIAVIATILIIRSRRHATDVNKMANQASQVEFQSNPVVPVGSNTL